MDAEEKSFLNSDGHNIHCVRWMADPSKAKALVLILHGGAEHSGRYVAMVTALTSRGMVVASHDHRGHGRSEGPRLFVNTFQEYIDDAVLHINILRNDFPDLPLFIIGHSMGATVALCVSLDYKETVKVKGMAMISPAFVSTKTSVPAYKVLLARLVAKVCPEMQVGPIDPNWMTQDSEALEDYKSDPLVYHGGVKARWGLAYLDLLSSLSGRFPEVKLPFLTIHGTGDKLWSAKGSDVIYEQASSQDKTIKMFDGAFHQVHHEPNGVGSECISMIVSWIEERS